MNALLASKLRDKVFAFLETLPTTLAEIVTNIPNPFSQGKNNVLHCLSDNVTRILLITVQNSKTYHNHEN